MSDLAATYIGHATSLVSAGSSRVLTDPLLRGSLMGLLRRRHAEPALGSEPLDAVLISHVHHDHLDLPSLRRLPEGTPIVVPFGAGRLLRRKGFERVEEVGVGDRLRFGALEVEVTPAVHIAVRRGAQRSPALGYLIGDGRANAYFAGDTELFAGMADLAGRVDLALLPIWGWGPTLGPGHMNPEQAAEAVGMLRPRRAVPIHWGTYSPLAAPRLWPWMSHGPARGFAEHAATTSPETEVVILEPGQSVAAG
ncbi:MAG TPA: MBL fold metallo-hydrolase [Solirubrobacterales bacterium]|nr:MBL fold metallo-hydrolase [Solirubrobacterales bacterium]